MKILFLIPDLSLGGGGERVVVTLANEFAHSGHQVAIMHFGAKSAFAVDRRIVVHSPRSRASALARRLSRIRGVRRMVAEFDPDAVLGFGYTAATYLAAARRRKSRTIFIASERNDPATEPAGLLARFLRDVAYRAADCIVCQTPDAMQYHQRHRRSLIMNPLRADLPEPWDGERRKVIVNFSRLEPQKNLPLLLRSFARFHREHSDYELELFGEGSLRENLVVESERLGVSRVVHLRGFEPELLSKVVDAGIFVSSSDHEGLSNSMLEALAIGLPTICTDCPVGGARAVIADGVNGRLVPVGDEDALYSAMCELASSRDQAAQLSRQGGQIRDTLSPGNVAASWLELIQELADPGLRSTDRGRVAQPETARA